MIRALLIALLLAVPASAQERITPHAFLRAVEGKTMRFTDLRSGMSVGVERFVSDRISVWKGPEDICVYGQITTPDGQVCFLYPDLGATEPVCWVPFINDGELLVRLVGGLFAQAQRAERVDPAALDCLDAPIT